MLLVAIFLVPLCVSGHAKTPTCYGTCESDAEGVAMLQTKRNSLGLGLMSRNMMRGLSNASVVIEAATSAGIILSLHEAEQLVQEVQRNYFSKDTTQAVATISMTTAATKLSEGASNNSATLQETGISMAQCFLLALLTDGEITKETVFNVADIAVTAGLGILSASNPLLGMFATIGYSFFKSMFEPDPPPPSPEEMLYKQIMEEIGLIMSKSQVQTYVASVAAEAAAISDELNFMAPMLQDADRTNLLYQLLVQHDIAKASYKLKTYTPPASQKGMYAYYMVPTAQTLEQMQVSVFSEIVMLQPDFKAPINDRLKELIAGSDVSSWKTFFNKVQTDGLSYINTAFTSLNWKYETKDWDLLNVTFFFAFKDDQCNETSSGQCSFMGEDWCSKQGCQIKGSKQHSEACKDANLFSNPCQAYQMTKFVEEKTKPFEKSFKSHEKLKAAVTVRRRRRRRSSDTVRRRRRRRTSS